jgi:hypothetical protein
VVALDCDQQLDRNRAIAPAIVIQKAFGGVIAIRDSLDGCPL